MAEKKETKARAAKTPIKVDKNVPAEEAPVELDQSGEPVEEPKEEPVAEEQVEETAEEPKVDYYPSPYGRRVVQKAVLYTDGLSGTADLNHERAYEYNEKLQSNDAAEREAGDQSLSEAAEAQRTDTERREADNVKQGNRM